jgi:hypothetical protein
MSLLILNVLINEFNFLILIKEGLPQKFLRTGPSSLLGLALPKTLNLITLHNTNTSDFNRPHCEAPQYSHLPFYLPFIPYSGPCLRTNTAITKNNPSLSLVFMD